MLFHNCTGFLDGFWQTLIWPSIFKANQWFASCDKPSVFILVKSCLAYKSSRMKAEVFGAPLSAQIQPNASKLIGRCFTVQMDIDLKHTAKATKDIFKAKKWNVLQWPSHIIWPESNWACVSLAEAKTEGKTPKTQAGSADGYSKGLAEHHQGRNPASDDAYVSNTSGSHWL